MNKIPWRQIFLFNPLLGLALCIQVPVFGRRLKKVGFPVVDADGRLIGKEWMWCQRVGFDLFILDNIPQFTVGVALGDFVSAGWSCDGWQFIACRFRQNRAQAGAPRNENPPT